jgi:uncharacterized protein YjiS (DUF1127 family)
MPIHGTVADIRRMEMRTSHSLYAPRGIVVAPASRAWRHPIASPLAALLRMVSALRREVAVRRAATTLEGMSDHELKDIGISRGDIRRVVREGRPLHLT